MMKTRIKMLLGQALSINIARSSRLYRALLRMS